MQAKAPPAHQRQNLLTALTALTALSGTACSPTIPACDAQDIYFTEQADDEAVVELSVIGCVSGNFSIENTLVSELAFPFLEEVGGSLVISDNLVLTRVDLPSLTRVGGTLEISYNVLLSELELPALEQVGDLVVLDNPELPAEEEAAAFAGLDVTDDVVVE